MKGYTLKHYEVVFIWKAYIQIRTNCLWEEGFVKAILIKFSVEGTENYFMLYVLQGNPIS